MNSEQPSSVCFFCHTTELHPLWGGGSLSIRGTRHKAGQASRTTARRYFVYIQGDLDHIPPANLSCWNSGHTWPTELRFLLFIYFRGLEALGLAEALAKGGKRQEIWAAEHTTGPGSLSWISEKAHYSGMGRESHWGVEGMNRSSRRSVHQSGCGAFRHITAGTNGDQGLEWDPYDSPESEPQCVIVLLTLSSHWDWLLFLCVSVQIGQFKMTNMMDR